MCVCVKYECELLGNNSHSRLFVHQPLFTEGQYGYLLFNSYNTDTRCTNSPTLPVYEEMCLYSTGRVMDGLIQFVTPLSTLL